MVPQWEEFVPHFVITQATHLGERYDWSISLSFQTDLSLKNDNLATVILLRVDTSHRAEHLPLFSKQHRAA